MHILGKMSEALASARAGLGEHAPRIEQIKIPTDKIREVIGTGGKVIREIVEKTGAKIDIQDDGTVKVAFDRLLDAGTQPSLDISLPLNQLAPGAYRLQVAVTDGTNKAMREVALIIRP